MPRQKKTVDPTDLSREEFLDLKQNQEYLFSKPLGQTGAVVKLLARLESNEPQNGVILRESFKSAASGKTYSVTKVVLENGNSIQLNWNIVPYFALTEVLVDVEEWLMNLPDRKFKKRNT